MVVLSAALMVGAVYLGRRLVAQAGRLERDACRGGAYIVAVAVVMLVLPTINETPRPMRRRRGHHRRSRVSRPTICTNSGSTSLGTQVVIWTTIGLVFGAGDACDGRAKVLAVEREASTSREPSVSEVVRLTLVSHAMTDAMSAGRFPTDEPLNASATARSTPSIDLGVTDSAFCGPEKRTSQTAELLGLQAADRPTAGRSGLRPLAR